MVTLKWVLEGKGWGAAANRPDVGDAGDRIDARNAELGVQGEPEQEDEKQAAGGNLMPQVDRADPLRTRPGLALGLLRIGGVCGTREQEAKESAKRAGVTMVVRIGNQEQEPDCQHHERRRHATSRDAYGFPPRCTHLPSRRSRTE